MSRSFPDDETSLAQVFIAEQEGVYIRYERTQMAEAVTACQGCLTHENIGSCASILDWKLRSPERWEKSVRLWASHVSECVNCATEHWKRCVVPVVISWQSFPEVETGC